VITLNTTLGTAVVGRLLHVCTGTRNFFLGGGDFDIFCTEFVKTFSGPVQVSCKIIIVCDDAVDSIESRDEPNK